MTFNVKNYLNMIAGFFITTLHIVVYFLLA
jgi:hypothetical protein